MTAPVSLRIIALTPSLPLLESIIASQFHLNCPCEGLIHFFSLLAELVEEGIKLEKDGEVGIDESLYNMNSFLTVCRTAVG